MAAIIGLIAIPSTGLAQSSFRRGDVDGDGEVGARDFALFQRHFGQDLTALEIPCQDAYDINDDGFPFINLFDFVTLVAAMGQPETLPAPGGIECGLDPTGDGLTCLNYTGCPNDPPPSLCDGQNLSGTVNLPPEGKDCEYFTEDDLHMIIDGLPPGTTVNISVIHGGFEDIIRTPGGPGEETEEFDSTVELRLEGTGALEGFFRVIVLEAPTVVDTLNYDPPAGAFAGAGAGPTQFIEADLRELQGGIVPADGDPHFESLTVTAGTANGLPSPGGTLLEPNTPTEFDVDSAFSVTYRIDFVGADGSLFDSLSGTTEGEALMALPKGTEVPITSEWGYRVLIGALLLGAVGAMLARRLRAPTS
jgi:hypothetical protein